MLTTVPPPPPPRRLQQSNVAAWIAIIQQGDVELMDTACQHLLQNHITTDWSQMAVVLPELEAAAEGGSVAAAHVASRLLFYLHEPVQALHVALLQPLDTTTTTNDPLFEKRLVTAALDVYTKRNDNDTTSIDINKLETLVFSWMDNAVQQGAYAHAWGLALEAKNGTKLQQVLSATPIDIWSQAAQSLLQTTTTTTVMDTTWRQEALQVVATCYTQAVSTAGGTLVSWTTAAPILVPIWHALHDYTQLAQLLYDLPLIHAQQWAWDLVTVGESIVAAASSKDVLPKPVTDILVGGKSAELYVSLLYAHSHADPLIMQHLKSSLDERGNRVALLHTATILAHAYLYAGTANDSFLRNNLDWMKKASNW